MKKNCFILGSVIAASAMMWSCSSAPEELFSEVDYFAVKESPKSDWGFVGPDGKLLFPDEFKNKPTAIVNGYFTVEENDAYTLYSVGDKPEPVKNGEDLVSVGYVRDGIVPIARKNSRIAIFNVKSGEDITLEPDKGKEIINSDIAFCDGLLSVENEDGKRGYVDKKGKVVIELKYDVASAFSEGLAVVAVKDDDGDYKYTVIDTKGKTIFTLKDGYDVVDYQFSYGYLAVRDNNEHILMYDKKGESTKLSSKATSIDTWNGKYIIYGTDDSEYGVMNFDGEILVRAKYDVLYILPGDKFLAVDEDKEVGMIINKDGEEQSRYEDYQQYAYFAKFGVWAKDRSTVCMLDKDGKMVKGCEFDQMSYSPSQSYYVQSDYFSVDAIVKDIAALIGNNGVDKYKFGEAPSVHFSEPRGYTYTSNVTLGDIDKEGFRYSISTDAYFAGYMANSEWDYSNYEWNYIWNPSCTLSSFAISARGEREIGLDGGEALIKELTAKGFKVDKRTKSGSDELTALLVKGNVIALVGTKKESYQLGVAIIEKTDDMLTYCRNLVESDSATEADYVEDEFID